jgi:hypothetical protein
MFALTLRTLDLALLIFLKGKNDFKRLLAIFAVKFIAGHMGLRKRPGHLDFYTLVYAYETLVSRQAKDC